MVPSPPPPAPPPPAVRRHRGRRPAALVTATIGLTVALVAALSSCGAAEPPPGTAAPAVPRGDALDLTGDCPARIVIQAGWFPTADVALPFALLGGDARVDSGRKRVTGSLVVAGKDTGIDLEFRSGGNAVGFQNGPTVAYTDESITMVITNIDEAIVTYGTAPMQAVMAPVNGDPQALIFDPETYPDFAILGDIGQTNTKVLFSPNAQAAFGYLASGTLRPSQLDASYDGSPSSFVAAGGKLVVQGYVTNEVGVYESLPQWGKPVDYFLIQDSGYPNYAGVLAIRPRDKDRLRPCLRKLVPLLQQAQIETWKNPAPVAERITTSVEKMKAPFFYGPGSARFGFCQLQRTGLVGNPKVGPIGTLESGKVKRVLDILIPIFTGKKVVAIPGLRTVELPADLSADDLATNEFLNPTLRLPDQPTPYYSSCPERKHR